MPDLALDPPREQPLYLTSPRLTEAGLPHLFTTRHFPGVTSPRDPGSPFDADALLSARVSGLAPEDSPAAGAPLIADFSRLTPDERFFPLEEFTHTLAEAWGRRPARS